MATPAQAVLTNISEMIDLALGTPEVGVVDFCMLQTVLHCLAQQLRVLDKNVELRGSAASLPVGKPPENAQTIAIAEFIVDTEAPGNFELATVPPSPDQESVLVVERRRRNDPQAFTTTPGKGSMLSTTGKGSGGSGRTAATSPSQAAPTSAAVHATTTATPAAPGAAPFSSAAAPTTPATAPAGTAPAGTAPAGSPFALAPEASVTASSPNASRTMSGFPPQRRPSLEKLSLVTLSKFTLLENTVADLKDRVYGTSPKNEAILEEVRSQSNLKAITDMWTNMNVSSRLDAAEEGIKKLSSLIEDLIGETATMQKKIGTVPGTKKKPETATGVPKSDGSAAASPSAVASLSAVAPPSAAAPPSSAASPSAAAAPPAPFQPQPPAGASQAVPSYLLDMLESWRQQDDDRFASQDELMQLLAHVQSMRDDLNNLTRSFSDAMKELLPSFVAPVPPASLKIKLIPPAPAPRAPLRTMTFNAESTLPEPMNKLEGRLLEKLAQLERDLKKCCDSVKVTEGSVQDQLTSYQDQLEDLQKHTTGKFAGNLSPDLVKDLQGLMQLFETVQNMQIQLQQVHETALNLAAEKEDRQNHIDALLEQIELLKVIKLDREDMVEALADKADLRMLARKVSHDQFENACDDLSKGLEHALGKLNVQESLWQQALDDIQREIEQKLDKMELSPVKDFFNNKLKQLQDNLKAMAALRREAEAAGTKRRLLRDVNCISCDAKAVMSMDPVPPQTAKPLPANLSMKPYLSYELDAIRKNQASSLPQRNMHDWEHVQQQMQPAKPHKVRSETDKHLCNRYCGGSHTVTTPAQRVARLGHFIKQWGPEVLPLSSGFAAGDDGRLYKISTSEGAGVGPGGAIEGAAVCTPKSPAKKPTPPPAPKPIIISAECRCLDPDTAEHPPPKN